MQVGTNHSDWPARAHVIIIAIPAVEVRVFPMLQNVLLSSEVWVIKTDPSSTLYTDRVHSVHETSVLEVITAPKDLQLPACEVFALVESDLK